MGDHTMKLSTLLKTLMFALVFCAGTAFAQTKAEICTDGLDNDGDKLVDCADNDCSADPACKKAGADCSPGYYKNHVEVWCGTCVSEDSCDEVVAALSAKGPGSELIRDTAKAILDGCYVTAEASPCADD
jgi:hypothetical protein